MINFKTYYEGIFEPVTADELYARHRKSLYDMGLEFGFTEIELNAVEELDNAFIYTNLDLFFSMWNLTVLQLRKGNPPEIIRNKFGNVVWYYHKTKHGRIIQDQEMIDMFDVIEPLIKIPTVQIINAKGEMVDKKMYEDINAKI